nr:MAG TPA: hypothetical protein [Bacteriophage sp.]DAW98727.1 MAG TPA: hypothetical protein [Caudoviricetes sp.]
MNTVCTVCISTYITCRTVCFRISYPILFIWKISCSYIILYSFVISRMRFRF